MRGKSPLDPFRRLLAGMPVVLLSFVACVDQAEPTSLGTMPGAAVGGPAPDAAPAPVWDAGVAGSDAAAAASRDAGGAPIVAPAADAGAQLASGDSGSMTAAPGVDGSFSGGDASSGDAGTPPSMAGFPRMGEPVSVAAKGPYGFKTYTDGLSDPVYESAIMYYPDGAPPPFAAIVLSPGFLASKENYTMLGEIFASHGFAMMLTTPTSVLDLMPERGKDLVAAVARIATENARSGSPLLGKLAADRVCVTGQSMGGGGTLHAATELGNKIRCAVPLQPYEPGTQFPKITAPILFIAAQADDVAGVAENARVHYDSIPASVEKIFAEFKGADHFLTTNAGVMWEEQSTLMVAFYKLKLEDDQRYAPFLYGGMEPKAALSRYEFTKK
jgi:dienelactone hydrolase